MGGIDSNYQVLNKAPYEIHNTTPFDTSMSMLYYTNVNALLCFGSFRETHIF